MIQIGETSVKVPVQVEVYDFNMPQSPYMRTSYLIWQDWLMDGELDNTIEKYGDYYDMMLDYNLNAYYFPANTGDIDGFIECLRKYYDKVASYGIPYRDTKEVFAEDNSYEGVVGENYSTIDNELFAAYLTAIAKACKEDGKNYFDKMYYYFDKIYDEVTEDRYPQMEACITETNVLEEKKAKEQELPEEMAESLKNAKHLMSVVHGWQDGFAKYEELMVSPLYDNLGSTKNIEMYENLISQGYAIESYGTVQSFPYSSKMIDEYMLTTRDVFWSKFDYGLTGDLFWCVNGYCNWGAGDVVGYGRISDLYGTSCRDGVTDGDEVRYQVYRNGKEVKAGSSFTVGKYDRYEVYITATDSSILENESTGYLIFLGSGLKGEIATMSTDEYETINYGGESQLRFNGVQKGFFYPFDAKIEEENGNRYVKLTQNKPGYGRMEILFPTKQNERGVVANFDFKVGGTLSGQLSNSTVLFEIGGETVTVADVKAGKRFTVSIPNLYNRLPDESGLRTQAVYFENCENFLKEKGLYLCVDNIQVEKVFEDLYNETNSFDTLALNKTGIVINSGNTVLKLVDRTKYELAYQVYRNGTEKVNRLNITRSGYEYYEVEISVLYKGTKQVRTKTKMTFQWDADAFITMENGEKFYHVAAANERPAYDQLLDSRDTFLMEMFPFLGELKKDARNNTYLALTPSDIRDGAALAIVNIGDASKHSENVGFTCWIEGDVSGLAGDTLLAIVGNTEIRAKDIGVQFSYLNKLSFNGCFSDPILIRNYDVLYQKGLKLCVDNVWRKKIVEENLFKGTYKVVNECNRFAVTSQSITTNNGTVLQLADSGKFELVCEIYKNGTERVGATNIYLQGNDFYSVRVSVRNKSTQKVHRTIELIFTDKTDSFSAMEEGESFWRVPASESHSVYDQFLDSEKNVQMEFYPFVGELKTENGNTYTVLKASGTAERAAISFINVKDTSAHKADVGFDFWIEGDAQGASAEDVVAVIGGQTIRVKDIGKKFYYQNRLVFDGCYSESILIENAELLETKGLELCIDNVWRAKRFNNAYDTVNVCDEFSLNEKEIVTNGTQVALQLTDSSKFKLSYAVYKNGVEKTTATEIHREGTDFYNVDVTLIEKATNKAHSRFTLVFSGIVDKFLAMEDGESFNLIPSSDKNPEYCQLLDGRGTYQMSLYPFTGEWKTISGNTYMSLKVNGNGEGAALSFVSMEDASEHQADVGFTFWIEGNSAEIDAEDVVAVIGGQTVKGEDIGKKYYYQDRLTFNQSFAAGVSIGNAELLATKDLRLCVDNIWRVKVEEEGEQANVKVDVVLDAAGSNSKGGFWVTTSKPDDFYTCDSWMDKPEATTGGVYVNGILNPGCDIIKFSWGVYYIAVSDGGITAKEGTTVVLDGIYGRGSNDPKYGDNYTVKFNQAIFQYTGGSWKQLSEMPAEPGETADATIDLALDAAGSNTTNGFWVVPSNSDDFYTCDSWQDKPEAITGGVYVDGTLYPGCVIIKFSWGVYYIAVSDGGITAKEGTTVVLDGIYGRGSSDPKYGDDYTVKFNKTTFEYKSGSWKQK